MIDSELQWLTVAMTHARNVPAPSGVSESTIDAFVRRTGIAIPLPLREWLRFANGLDVDPGGILGIETELQRLDIEHVWNIRPDFQDQGWIPVAKDGCGNYWLLATRPEDGPGNPVLFLDPMRDYEKPVFVCASDLYHFLKFLFRRERYGYEAEDWPFGREHVLRLDPDLRRYRTWPKAWETDIL